VSEAEKIHGLSPAGFEEYCHQYLETRGWKIFKNNNYDGGIDIRALKEFKEGTVKNLLVQCKHWNKPIPPGEMRDFKAGCDEEAMEHEKILMFITSSQYSPGAREYAKKFNIELIDGDDLLK
jgi:restriction endonuclease Mrr